jgi:hypothetical protein
VRKLAAKPAAGMCGVAGSNTGEKTANRLSFNQKLKITISVCFAVFFCTLLLLFPVEEPWSYGSKVAEGSIPRAWSIRLRRWDSEKKIDEPPARAPALHGVGMLFRKGNRSMNELIAAHLTERVTDFELRMFVRTLYRSGALARADLVILFPRNSVRDEGIYSVIEEECDLGFKKVSSYFDPSGDYRNGSTVGNFSSLSVFNTEAFRRAAEEKNKRNKKGRDRSGTIRVGSVMGFEMDELDPDNILESFIDDPPAQLRRWVCYQLLLGYLRHKYRSVLLARIGAVVILSDAMAAVRNSSGLFLLTESRSWDIPAAGEEFLDSSQDRTPPRRRSRRRKTSQKPQPRATKTAANRKKKMALLEAVYGMEIWRSLTMEERRKRMMSSGIIAGTMSAVRALSNAMVNEVIRVTMERKSRAAFPDQVPLSYLIHQTAVLDRKEKGNLHLDGLCGHGRSWASLAQIIRRDLCSSPDDAALYPDCSIQSSQPSR